MRLVPPLIVSEDEIRLCAKLLAAAIEDVMPRPATPAGKVVVASAQVGACTCVFLYCC